jgi:hypothetical protein
MTVSPFQPERLDASVSPQATGTGLNAEYASYIQGKQIGQVGTLPQVTSADGSQLVIPPLANGKPAATTDVATTTTTTPATSTDATQPQLPPNVNDNPNLVVPAWQRFSQNAVATDGTLLPASGPGSPGDPGPGPMVPMWMRMAPMELQPQIQQEIAQHYGSASGTTTPTDQTANADPNATGDQSATTTTQDQTTVAQNDTNVSPSTAVTTGGNGPYAA